MDCELTNVEVQKWVHYCLLYHLLCIFDLMYLKLSIVKNKQKNANSIGI